MSSSAHPVTDASPSIVSPATTLASIASTTSATQASGFVDRRSPSESRGVERRQFGSSYNELSPDALELATAIDRYKIENRRRYITCEEMLAVVKQLGYRRDT